MNSETDAVQAPGVTVMNAAHNAVSFLDRALTSELQQEGVPLQVLVVDDASTDGTHRLAAAYDDPRVGFPHLPRNVGAAAARKPGLRVATNPLVAASAADDVGHPAVLARPVDV